MEVYSTRLLKCIGNEIELSKRDLDISGPYDIRIMVLGDVLSRSAGTSGGQKCEV